MPSRDYRTAAPDSGAANPLTPETTGFLFKSLTFNGGNHPYVLYVPRDYNPSRHWPLIVFLHGAGKCGYDGCRPISAGLGMAIINDSASWPFLVMMPQKPEVESAWEQYDDVVMAMLAQTRHDYPLDGSRIYLTGASQGGHGTWVLGALHADLWAAIAPVCGYGGELANIHVSKPGLPPAFTGSDSELGMALKDVPVWAFHGEADPVVPMELSKGPVDAVNIAGGSARLTVYPEVDHNSWDRAYGSEDLGGWFLSHCKEHVCR